MTVESFWAGRLRRAGLEDLAEKVRSGIRLAAAEGLRLHECSDLQVVGHLANLVRERRHGNVAYFVRNLHINYTNICEKRCRFCSFYARPGVREPFALSLDQVRQKLEACPEAIREVHIVGGINPELPYDYYLGLLRTVKATRPEVHIKAFTAIELAQIARAADRPLTEVLAELIAEGLGSVPGGGAEIFSERLHDELFCRKLTAEEWLETHRAVHEAGLKSNATMLYGHLERADERVGHFVRLRELQDKTGGFQAFVPLSFDPGGSDLSERRGPTGVEDLRIVALARLMLDNFDHIKSFWVMSSPQVAQVALWYGADDVDGTVFTYQITDESREGKQQGLSRSYLASLIERARRAPVERDGLYREVPEGGT